MFLDCGAGIGRVTKNLLLPLFETVDIVEQNPDFVEKAKDFLVSEYYIFNILFNPSPRRSECYSV